MAPRPKKITSRPKKKAKFRLFLRKPLLLNL